MTYTLTQTRVEPFFVTADIFDVFKEVDDYRMEGDNLDKIVDFVNRCLCVYWKALKNVNAQENTSAASQMRARLDDLASTGWGKGVSDLNEAMGQLRYGYWTDKDLTRYYKGEIYDKHVYAPTAFVNFAEAFDKKVKQLKADFRDHMQLAQMAMADADRDSWAGCKDKLNQVKGIAGKVQDYLWLLDAYAIGKSQATQQFMEATGKHLGAGAKSATSFVDIVGRIDAVVNMYTKMHAQLGSQKGSKEAAAAFAAMRAAVDFLPILGSFYAAMLDAIPGTVEIYNNYTKPYFKKLAAARDNLREYNRLESLPSKQTCQHCKKSVMTPCK